MDAISPDLALKTVLEHCFPVESRWLSLEATPGMVLREPILADRDLPPYDRVMMDGVGVHASALEQGLRRFAVLGTQQAGIPALALEDTSGCLEVMTGAVLPRGVDTILPVEWLNMENGFATLMEGHQAKPGEFIHVKGSDYSQGSQLIEAGSLLTPPAIGIAASCGYSKLQVPRKLQLGLITTGDEAVPIDDEPGPYQIRQSNRLLVESILRKAPIELSMHALHLPDDYELQKRSLDPLLPELDVLVFCGGISKGRFDYFKKLIQDWKAELHFDRVLQRPGKPMSFASLEDKLIFGLPGNPNASLLGASQYLMPALRKLAGGKAPSALSGRLTEAVHAKGPWVQWRPARLIPSPEDGHMQLELVCPRNSGDFARLAQADGWTRLDPSDDPLPKGLSLPFYPW